MRASLESSHVKLRGDLDRADAFDERPSTLGWRSRLGLAAIAAVAFALGVTAPALLLGEARVVPVVAALAALTAVVALRKFQTFVTHRPTVGEIGFGSVSTLFPAALLGAVALVVYGFFLLLFAGVDALDGSIDGERIAFYATVVVTVIATPGYSALATRQTARQLFPEGAGLRSPFFTLTKQRRVRVRAAVLLGVTTVIAAAVLGAWVGAEGIGLWAIAFQLSLLFGSSGFWQLGTADRSRAAADAVDAVQRALDALGFAVTPDPRTGNESVDPLLSACDLLAQRDGTAVAVEVSVGDAASTRIDWTEGSKLLNAAQAFDSAVDPNDGVATEALLVLVGASADTSLELFARDTSVHVIELPATAARELRTAEGEELRSLATRWFPHFAHGGEGDGRS